MMFLSSPIISSYFLITMNQPFFVPFSQVSWSLPFHQFLALILLNQHTVYLKKKQQYVSHLDADDSVFSTLPTADRG